MKHIKSIDFTQDEAFFQGPMMAESDEPSPSYPINGMWFQEDGVTAKVGEPVTLTGAVYSWNRVVGDLASVNFSFDMGKTWQDVKIADQVTDFESVPVGHLFPGLDAEQGGQVPGEAAGHRRERRPDEEARHAVRERR